MAHAVRQKILEEQENQENQTENSDLLINNERALILIRSVQEIFQEISQSERERLAILFNWPVV